MAENNNETARAELRVTAEEARRIADLLRYAISLNTTAGLVSPTQRRLATSTYRAVELAALVLQGKTFTEAVEESGKTWTGSLEDDHRHALELLQRGRDTLKEAMANHLPPEQLEEYLEVSQDQFVQLLRPDFMRKVEPDKPEG
jgi:hypothetical protein